MTSGYSDFVVFELLFMAFFAIMGIPTIVFISGVVNHFRHVKPQPEPSRRPYRNSKPSSEDIEEEDEFPIF